ncbi:MAG: competence/damage-inducible protein A [Limisphaerales bacterium]
MIVELINTGSELMLGRTLNTHQQWLCRQLADRGYVVSRQVAIADAGPAIQQAVRESLGRADLILVTGGLGPTSDDVTRELIADLLGKPLREDPAVVASLKAFFAARNRPMPARNLVQAQVPEGALVLPNPHGTAPGLAMKVEQRATPQWLILLPGPPRELQPMFLEQVVPLLQREFPAETFVCRTLRTSGLGESALAELIDAPLQPLIGEGLELGYCARPGQVDVRLAARGPQAEQVVARAEAIVQPLLAEHVYGCDEVDLETALIRELTRRSRTLALAESCTGGLLAHRLTNVPGASAVLLAGLVTYANAAKERFAGVPPELIATHGAVSEPVARALAEGARRATGADYGVGITGIAGPGGGSPDKPVGTVFLAVSSATGTAVKRQWNQFDRVTFKEVTTQQALNLLWRQVRNG